VKVLAIPNAPALSAEKHIFDYLKRAGHAVTVLPIDLLPGSRFAVQRLSDPAILSSHKIQKYDVVLCSVHTTSGPYVIVRTFIESIAPRLGVVFYGHDLLEVSSEIPTNPCVAGKRTHSIVYHLKHRACSLRNLDKQQVHLFPWYKLSIPDTGDIHTAADTDIDKDEDAIIPWPGAHLLPTIVDTPIPGFRRVWQKRFWERADQDPTHAAVVESVYPGATLLPPEFDGCASLKLCCSRFKFFLCADSSLLVECLLYRALPILFSSRALTQRPADDIVSVVSVRGGLGEFKAVTTDNLARKLSLLRRSTTRFEQVRADLFYSWFPSGYCTWPPFEKSLLDLIERLDKCS
jgi:hypothetical protein